jgi:hypothetical protein
VSLCRRKATTEFDKLKDRMTLKIIFRLLNVSSSRLSWKARSIVWQQKISAQGAINNSLDVSLNWSLPTCCREKIAVMLRKPKSDSLKHCEKERGSSLREWKEPRGMKNYGNLTWSFPKEKKSFANFFLSSRLWFMHDLISFLRKAFTANTKRREKGTWKKVSVEHKKANSISRNRIWSFSRMNYLWTLSLLFAPLPSDDEEFYMKIWKLHSKSSLMWLWMRWRNI